MTDAYRVLNVDDDDAQAEMVREFLHISGIEHVDHVNNIHAFWLQIEENQYDIVLLDYKLPDGTGLDVLDQMTKKGCNIPVVMVTGQGNERIAVQAIQRGAADYLLKSGAYLVTLPALIRKTIRSHELRLSVAHSIEQVRYQATLLNNVRDAVVVWDMSDKITYWNPAATALFGWSIEERIGQSVAPNYLNTFKPPISIPREEDTVGHHVVRKFEHKDGKIIWVSSRLTALRNGSQGDLLIGYMDVSHDITRRVTAEQALRESEARYRAIVEDYQTELICRFRSNGTLTFVNEVFCRYFSKSRDELLGMNFLYFIPEAERPKIVQHLLTFGPDKAVATLEHQVILPNQGTRWLQRTDRVILNEQKRIFEFQSVARDITNRKKMEEQIQAAQSHLVQAARMATIGEMASGVAHQIYNPLTTIIADAQLLLRKLPVNQPGRDSAEAIEQAGWRLQQVVARLMDFSQPTSEALNTLSINETIHSAISLISTHIEETGCKLEPQLSEELPQVRGNARQLESLWVNLLLLARDAITGSSGSIIRVNSRANSSDTIVIEIYDDGHPIPSDQLATIFEPNFIGPTIGRGTGMELSICREIVRQHSGEITAIRAPDSNTIFRVILPVEV